VQDIWRPEDVAEVWSIVFLQFQKEHISLLIYQGTESACREWFLKAIGKPQSMFGRMDEDGTLVATISFPLVQLGLFRSDRVREYLAGVHQGVVAHRGLRLSVSVHDLAIADTLVDLWRDAKAVSAAIRLTSSTVL
jgi:hypothetical protein